MNEFVEYYNPIGAEDPYSSNDITLADLSTIYESSIELGGKKKDDSNKTNIQEPSKSVSELSNEPIDDSHDHKIFDHPMTRNSTSFINRLTVKLKQLHKEYLKLRNSGDKITAALKYHQWLVVEWMSSYEYVVKESRGLLCYHDMGTGKTRIGAATMIFLIEIGIYPIFIAPKSLQNNMMTTIAEIMKIMNPEVTDNEIIATQKKITVASSDAHNMFDQVTKHGSTLDNRVIVIDEAHDFFRAIVNSGNDETNSRKLYNTIMSTKNLRLLCLTGSPIVKNVFEMVPMFNMLAGREILPIQYDLFMEMYVDLPNRKLKNREILQNRLFGLVSYVSTELPLEPNIDASKIPKPRDDHFFPELLPMKVIRVEMSEHQYKTYLLAREKEELELKTKGKYSDRVGKGNALSLPSSEMNRGLSTYYVHSRMISNFCPPDTYRNTSLNLMPDEIFVAENSPKLAMIAKMITDEYGSAVGYSQFVDYGLGALGRFLKNKGYREFITRSKISREQNKLIKQVDIRSNKTLLKKGIDSSEEHDAELDEILEKKEELDRAKRADDFSKKETKLITSIGGNNKELDQADRVEYLPKEKSNSSELARAERVEYFSEEKQAMYALLSGRVDPKDRIKMQQEFNKPANKHGDVIKFFGFSATGAQGLDLHNAQIFISCEPYWTNTRIDQAVTRIRRLGSHDLLPRKLRQVQPYMFLSIANKKIYDGIPPNVHKESESIDEKFFNRAQEHGMIIEDARKLLQEISIECVVNGYPNCRLCSPTDKILYHDDPQIDVKLPNPCEDSKETEIEAKMITLGNNKYYYSKQKDGSLEFYQFDDELGAYVSISPDDSMIDELSKLVD